jgi:hypothetical protein
MDDSLLDCVPIDIATRRVRVCLARTASVVLLHVLAVSEVSPPLREPETKTPPHLWSGAARLGWARHRIAAVSRATVAL